MNFDNKDLLGLVVIRSLFRRVRENVKGDFQLSRVSVRPPGGGLSVHLSTRNNSALTARIFMEIDI